jgi:hypothetical protein
LEEKRGCILRQLHHGPPLKRIIAGCRKKHKGKVGRCGSNKTRIMEKAGIE